MYGLSGQNISVNHIIDAPGCQYYFLPAGWYYNVTYSNGTRGAIFADGPVVFALGCNNTDAEYREFWEILNVKTVKAPFRGTLPPLMISLSVSFLCIWVIIGGIAALRQRTRPWFHKLLYFYECAVITCMYIILHVNSYTEHMDGYESIDTFVRNVYGKAWCVGIFVAFMCFMICECHMLIVIAGSRRPLRLLILSCGLAAWFLFENLWWVICVAMHPIFDVYGRSLAWQIKVWFYLEIVSYALYMLAIFQRAVSARQLMFHPKNRALCVVTMGCMLLPLAFMIVTVVQDCFKWAVPLTLVTRAISLYMTWDLYKASIIVKHMLEEGGNLGRLVDVKRVEKDGAVNPGLGDSGKDHGAIMLRSVAARVWSRLANPIFLFEPISINDVAVLDSDSATAVFSIPEEEAGISSSSPKLPVTSDAGVVHHHPSHKHTIKVQDPSGKILRPRPDRSSSQQEVNLGSLNGQSFEPTVTSDESQVVSEGSRAPQSHSMGTTYVNPSMDPTPPNTLPPSTQSATPSSSSDRRAASNNSADEPHAEEPSSSSPSPPRMPPVVVEQDPPPGFVPHPGFRSGDYHMDRKQN